MQVDDAGKLVKDFGPPVPEDAPEPPPSEPETIIHTPPLAAASRPSLEVETEVHAHLAPRLEAHLRRIEAWDMRKGVDGVLVDVQELAVRIGKDFELLGGVLNELTEVGFVARTTALTRKLAALRPGVAVKLRPDILAKTVDLFYTEADLEALTVMTVGENSVLLKTGSGREMGPLPFSHVVPQKQE